MELTDTGRAAEILGLAPHTLENWRVHGRGPRFVKIGRRVLYPVEELRAYIERNLRSSTSERGPDHG